MGRRGKLLLAAAILAVAAYGGRAAAEKAFADEGGGTAAKPSACPACGAEDIVPIVYGFPSEELFNAAERGEVDLGG